MTKLSYRQYQLIFIVTVLILTAGIKVSHAIAVTIGDVTHIQGLRENQLIGYGLIVGLQGTGDSRYSQVTSKTMANMLEKFGLNLNNRDFSSRNSAAVMVTATLMPFMRSGDRLDVHISSIGDAKSLQGGTLVMTPLIAGNQEIFAYAQGPISVGGYYVGTRTQSIKKNITTVGVISGGAIVEKAVDAKFIYQDQLKLTLDRTDFALAAQIVSTINQQYGMAVASTSNATEIELQLPNDYKQDPVGFIAKTLKLGITTDEKPSIVVDERTGTIVVGGDVRLEKVAISHGGLHIAIAGETKISQPMPLTLGQTVVAEELSLRADERRGEVVSLPAGATIDELVRALNAVGTLPREIMVILQNLKTIGALHAKIVTR